MTMVTGKLDITMMRDCEKFKSDGIKLSLTSDIAAKYFDSLIFQAYGFFQASEVGGMNDCMTAINQIDPEFPLVKLFQIDFEQDRSNAINDLKLRYNNQMNGINSEKSWTDYELKHVKAFLLDADGYLESASNVWNDLIAFYPRDVLALKKYNVDKIIRGQTEDIAYNSGFCRRHLEPSDPYYPFVLGYEGFGLEEWGNYDEAMNKCNESLSIYPWNSWATHGLAHVYDSLGNSNDCLEMLEKTRDNWMVGLGLQCHNLWHEALANLMSNNSNRIDKALELFDDGIFSRVKTSLEQNQLSHFQLSDAISLLTRIEIEDSTKFQYRNELKSRWDKIEHLMESSLINKSSEWSKSSNMTFYDAHSALAALGCHKKDVLQNLRDSCLDGAEVVPMETVLSHFRWENDQLIETVGNCGHKRDVLHSSTFFVTQRECLLPWIDAIEYYENKEYEECANILYPIRHKLRRLGGSLAQNDIFTQILCNALLLSKTDINMNRLKKVLFDRINPCCYGYENRPNTLLGGAFQRYMTDEIISLHRNK